MTRGRGVVLVVIVSLAFATDSFAGAPAFSIAQGPVTLLSTSELTVQANAQIPTSCTRSSSSPSRRRISRLATRSRSTAYRVSWSASPKGSGKPPLGPVIPIRGLPQFHAGVPIPGPNPTAGQCVAAWNAGAPLVAREAIRAQTPLAAYVGTESVSRGSSPGGPACSIYFALPRRANGVGNRRVEGWCGAHLARVHRRRRYGSHTRDSLASDHQGDRGDLARGLPLVLGLTARHNQPRPLSPALGVSRLRAQRLGGSRGRVSLAHGWNRTIATVRTISSPLGASFFVKKTGAPRRARWRRVDSSR